MKKGGKTVGLYLGENLLCAVELVKKNGTYTVNNLCQMQIPAGYIKDGCVIRIEEFAEELIKFFNTQGLAKDNIHISIPEEKIVLRLLKIPSMTEKETKGYLLGEAEQYVIFKDEEVAIDFSIVEDVQEGGQKHHLILLCATTKKLISSYYEAFKHSDIVLKQISPLSLSLAHCYKKVMKEKPIGIISIFDNLSNFYVFYQDRILFNRTIDIGSAVLKSVKPDEGPKAWDEFANEVQQTLGFYHSQFPTSISSLILWCGDKYSGLDSYLQKKIGLAVESAYPDINEGKLNGFTREHISSIYPEVSVALGSAKYYFEKEEVKFNVNLLPSHLRYRLGLDKRSKLAAALIPFIFASSFGYSYFLGKEIDKYQKEILQVDTKIQEADARAQSGQDLQNKIQQTKKEISFLQGMGTQATTPIVSSTYNVYSFLRDVRYLIPPEVWVSSSLFDGANFTISGYSLSQEGIAKFLVNLSAISSFSSVNLEYSKELDYEGKNIFEFKVNCGGKNI